MLRDEAIGSGLDVTPLDLQHAVGMGQIPHFAAAALFEAGQHELRAHRAVADEAALAGGFVQKSLAHGLAVVGWRDYCNSTLLFKPRIKFRFQPELFVESCLKTGATRHRVNSLSPPKRGEGWGEGI